MQKNIMFTTLNKEEKQELLKYLKTYKLEFRENLGLNKKIKFGIEIEAEGEELKKLLTNPSYRKGNLNIELLSHYKDYFKEVGLNSYDYEKCPWILKTDDSVKEGAEIHSPILSDTKENWENLKTICEFLKSINAVSTDKTSTHIHFNGQSYLKDAHDLDSLIKLYSVYENVLYLFGTGEFINFRSNIYKYATPVANDFQNTFQGMTFRTLDYKKILNLVDYAYYRGLRLINLNYEEGGKDTFEFRFANGTLSPVIIQNLINAEAKLCSCAVNTNFDEELIKRKFNFLRFSRTNREILKKYLETPLDDILEFVDLIFDNALDKLYFIRQCIKEPITDEKRGLQKAKKFY